MLVLETGLTRLVVIPEVSQLTFRKDHFTLGPLESDKKERMAPVVRMSECLTLNHGRYSAPCLSYWNESSGSILTSRLLPIR